jgi:hypothetical protein
MTVLNSRTGVDLGAFGIVLAVGVGAAFGLLNGFGHRLAGSWRLRSTSQAQLDLRAATRSRGADNWAIGLGAKGAATDFESDVRFRHREEGVFISGIVVLPGRECAYHHGVTWSM